MKQSNQTICPKCAAAIPDDAPSGLCPSCALEGAAAVTKATSFGKYITPPNISELAPHFPELEILELIGAGGMGAVYKARQPQLDRLIALKILSHSLTSDPAFVERFNREARVLGRLSHPNIVGIHDFGTAGPYCYLMMEYVDGVNLRQAMQAGRFTPTEALEMVQHLCSALKFAHEEGVLHRDIKPENILIDSKGRIKVADFGIAKLVGEDRQNDVTLTMQGSIIGSPHYMAPEQIETPGDVDQRADIYSLGVVLYELLTGGLPIGRFALPSEKASMDVRIDHIVMRTLEKEREARYQSVAEVGSEMEAVTKHPAPPSNKSVVSRGEPVAARFSLAAAILTGISIVISIIIVVASFIIVSIQKSESSGLAEQEGISDLLGGILFVLGLLAAPGTALIGFILGAKCLGEIRRSGGVKTGLGCSIFATTAWPILFLFILATLPLKMMTPSWGGSSQLQINALILVMFLSVFGPSWVLIRALYRWVKGVERKDGTRFQPGLGIPLLIVILLTIAGPVLLGTIAKVILPMPFKTINLMSGGQSLGLASSRDRAIPFEAINLMPDGASQVFTEDAEPIKPDAIDWYHGLPEVKIPLSLHSRFEVKFQLIRSLVDAADENRLQTIDIGGMSSDVKVGAEGDFPPYKTRLFIGTTAPRKDGAGLIAVCQWEQNRKVSIDLDFRDWQFEEKLPEQLVFSEEGVSNYVIATKNKNNPKTAEQLVLRVVVTDSY